MVLVHSPTILAMALSAAMAQAAPGSDGRRGPKEVAARVDRRFVRSCGAAMPGFARCHSWVLSPNLPKPIPDEPPFIDPMDYLTPEDLVAAYQLPTQAGANVTVAIVDAFDDPTAESDLGSYRSFFGLPACTTANGCFRKVNQSGTASPLPATDAGWSVEIALDVDMVSAACPSCKILLVEANSTSIADLGAAVNTAVSLGASVVSNSYGGSETSGDPATTGLYYNHAGVLIVASTGDGGFGVEYPSAAPTVLAVGGTTLTVSSGSPRGWIEAAWGNGDGTVVGGTGSGCSTVEAKPAWQTDTGCSNRTVGDVSAVAGTAVSVYTTTVPAPYAPGWQPVGGTSAASPLVAAIFAMTGHHSATPQYPYRNTSQFFDVIGGSNGTCSPSYLCTAVAGYDGPTGIGTPNGAALQSASMAAIMSVVQTILLQ
jgi:subtilase family serine protease